MLLLYLLFLMMILQPFITDKTSFIVIEQKKTEINLNH